MESLHTDPNRGVFRECANNRYQAVFPPPGSHKSAWVIVSGFTATLYRSTWIHIPLGTQFVHGALNGLNLVEVSQCSLYILALQLLFTPHLSNTD